MELVFNIQWDDESSLLWGLGLGLWLSPRLVLLGNGGQDARCRIVRNTCRAPGRSRPRLPSRVDPAVFVYPFAFVLLDPDCGGRSSVASAAPGRTSRRAAPSSTTGTPAPVCSRRFLAHADARSGSYPSQESCRAECWFPHEDRSQRLSAPGVPVPEREDRAHLRDVGRRLPIAARRARRIAQYPARAARRRRLRLAEHLRRTRRIADCRAARATRVCGTASSTPPRSARRRAPRSLTGRNHHTVSTGMIQETATGFPGYTGIIPKSCATIAEVLQPERLRHRLVGQEPQRPRQPDQRRPGRSTAGRRTWASTTSTGSSRARPTSSIRRCTAARRRSMHRRRPRRDTSSRSTSPTTASPGCEQQKSIAPDRPFFAYFAPGAAHAPHHPPLDWRGRHAGHSTWVGTPTGAEPSNGRSSSG